MKKALKIIGIGIGLIILSLISYLFLSTPKLPASANTIVNEVINADIPEFVNGKTGYIYNKNVKVWYESIMPADTNKGTMLLFMGISNDALGWPKSFIDKFVDAGYQVIRFDYRDTGLSDWDTNLNDDIYSLADLATDSKIILDSLNVEQANLIGVSLGGMVAQEFAINYPDRTNSLTSIMSSGNIMDETLPPISTEVMFQLIKTSIRYSLIPTSKNSIKLHIAARKLLQGDAEYDFDIQGTAEQVWYNINKRNGYNSSASSQHHEATYRSGSRYDKLKSLQLPVLVIHGQNDPFIPIEHSKKLANTVPNSKTKWIDNMGHDIPPFLTDSIYLAIEDLIK